MHPRATQKYSPMAGHLEVLGHSYTSIWVLEDALDDLGEGGASKRLGEDVCNHVTPRKVTKRIQ